MRIKEEASGGEGAHIWCVTELARPDDAEPRASTQLKADERSRTADPFITSEVLYQLSYVGVRANPSRRTDHLPRLAERFCGLGRTQISGA